MSSDGETEAQTAYRGGTLAGPLPVPDDLIVATTDRMSEFGRYYPKHSVVLLRADVPAEQLPETAETFFGDAAPAVLDVFRRAVAASGATVALRPRQTVTP